MKLMTWLFSPTSRGHRMLQSLLYPDVELQSPTISHLTTAPEQLPLWVQHSPIAMRYLHFLGPLSWDEVPRRPLTKQPLIAPLPYVPFLAACLVKIDQQISSMARLREYLVEHPALTWLLSRPEL